MRPEDLAEVVRIERACFSTPWPRGAFMEEISSNPVAHCLVIRSADGDGSRIVGGYICYWILQEELVINNVAVAPELRRRGLARKMMVRAIEDACAAGCLWAFLEVRPSNEAAISLYRDLGFEILSRRRRYYADTGEDALIMRAALKGLETR